MNDRLYQGLHYALGAVVTLFALVVYAMTVAPTLSYWDCGEFIACSYILGIPHPPGTPLYVVIGRLFSMLPSAGDIALRVNVVSVISSALAAGIAFFLVARLVRGALLNGRDEGMELWQGVVALGAGVSGALFMAFSATHWNNAVEAEVYGPSMFLILVISWLAIRFSEKHESPGATRYLVGIAYLLMLSLGIHMTVFLIAPVVFLLLVYVSQPLRRDWRFWVTGFVLFLVPVDVSTFLYASVIWGGVAIGLALREKFSGGWARIAAIMIAAWVGYSTQLFIPVRSAQSPNIDENNVAGPHQASISDTYDAFIQFLERKQYGQTSMVKRMFTRRGTWENQFGDHAHMGFYRYFKTQYGFGGWAMVPVMAVGFFGTWWLAKRKRSWGRFVLLLFLVGSAGLVLYMNFADGTQYYKLAPDAYMEVRNRDYFFTPGYIFFGLMLGLGLAGIADVLGRRSAMGKTLAMGIAVVAALLPLRTLQANWVGADRSRNFTPYDYAYNILESCEPNAILFTGGDNDTFPLWCLQEVYRVRPDIAVVNLSLANIDWYIYQMKHYWNLPVTLEDDQILWTEPDPGIGGMARRPKRPYRDPVSGSTHYMFTTRDGAELVTPAMLITEHVIYNNKWQRPVYFTGNPAGKTRLELERHTKIVGSVFQIIPGEANYDFDYERTAALMGDKFQYRSYDDPTIGLDDNAVGLAIVFPEKMIAISDWYRRGGDTATSEEWLNDAIKYFPSYWRTYDVKAQYLEARGDTAQGLAEMDKGISAIAAYVEQMPDNRLYWYHWGKLCEAAGRDEEAEKGLSEAFYLNPYDQQVYQSYIAFLIGRQKSSEAARAASKWLEYYPDDTRAQSLKSLPGLPKQ
ncbi:MAG: DUF2723 domain-containing protein [Candidatus Zixiibacteriota bacterium]